MHSDFILDKRQVRNAFEKAAASYDQSAVLQREVSNRMFGRLELIKYMPDRILDAGSGTGYGSRKLAKRYPESQLLAADIAVGMLRQSRSQEERQRSGSRFWPFRKKSGAHYACVDIEQLPFKDESIDMVWSNLTLQWCNDLDRTFREINRVLSADGLIMFSTLGPDTLKELRHAFAREDQYAHVNRFVDMHDIGDLLVHNRFATPVMDMEYITLTYDDVLGVMRDLKAIGAHTVVQGKHPGLTGKAKWQRIVAQYETFRVNGKLPATFEVVYGHAWKLPPKQTVVTPELRRQILME
ncbi:MAG: malonyl-ACP O-methyltransferase BioC [Nitrosomonas sp.]|nr:malonyl-ACP O-methyltransferase BioC [Nitrosomonas sp.]